MGMQLKQSRNQQLERNVQSTNIHKSYDVGNCVWSQGLFVFSVRSALIDVSSSRSCVN